MCNRLTPSSGVKSVIGQEDFIVDLLSSRGLITEAQLEEARKRVQEESADNMLAALYAIKAVDDTTVLKMLSEEYGMDIFDFDSRKERIPEHVIQMLPAYNFKAYGRKFYNRRL